MWKKLINSSSRYIIFYMKILLPVYIYILAIFYEAVWAKESSSTKYPTKISDCKDSSNISDLNYSDALEKLQPRTECLRKLLNSILDKRLLRLKLENQNQFKIEMKIQADFNSWIKKACGEWYRCNGNYKVVRAEQCDIEAIEYRTMLALQIQEQSLSVDFSNQKKTVPSNNDSCKNRVARKKEILDLLKSFTDGMCALPVDVWKNKTISPHCSEKIISNLTNSDNFEPDCWEGSSCDSGNE